jgi:hypothetical protein
MNFLEVKYIKFLIILFLFFPSVLYSQYLEQKDIDLFIKNSREIGLLIKNKIMLTRNDEWRNYKELMNIPPSVIYENIESFNYYFQIFLNCEIPNELENLFLKIGWENNGHKKYVVIMNIFSLLLMRKSMEMNMERNKTENLFPQERYLLVIDILKTFNAADLNLINTNLDEILKSFNKF